MVYLRVAYDVCWLDIPMQQCDPTCQNVCLLLTITRGISGIGSFRIREELSTSLEDEECLRNLVNDFTKEHLRNLAANRSVHDLEKSSFLHW